MYSSESSRRARTSTYGFSVETNRDFDHTVNDVIAALKKEGFGIIVDIDMQALFKKKIGVDEPRYRILGACDPMMAHQALRADPDIGLLLPCNVVVREDSEGHVTVSFMAPEAVLGLVNKDAVTKLGMLLRQRLEHVANSLQMLV
jgi:uncharacterized protein (DUF302 family)